jgi:hypothetical protein
MPTYANKAVLAFVFAFLASLLAQVQDKTEFSDLTPLQWVVAVTSAVVTSGAVYLIPNKDPHAQHQAESTQPPHA